MGLPDGIRQASAKPKMWALAKYMLANRKRVEKRENKGVVRILASLNMSKDIMLMVIGPSYCFH